MMKKGCKFLVLIIACLTVALTPLYLPSAISFVTTASTEENIFYHTAPTQSDSVFNKETIGTVGFGEWEKSLTSYTVSEVVDHNTHDAFKNKHPNAALLDNGLVHNNQTIVMTNKVNGMPANGSYTSASITLPANGYYQVAVRYFMIGDNSSFYLNDYEISLAAQDTWRMSAFYIHTDSLQSTSIVVKLCLGADNQYVNGTAYYEDFKVTAIRKADFDKETTASNLEYDEKVIDLTNKKDIASEFVTYTANDFEALPTPNKAIAKTEIDTIMVPQTLNFKDHPTFYGKDRANAPVMLLAAQENYATLKLKSKVTFLPNQVYMIQFYSITGADTTNFYLNIGELHHQITNVTTSYQNGWQLNTFFYIGGLEDDPTLPLTISLGYKDNESNVPTTGWACIDGGIKIYRVSGAFAAANANATGVHGTEDLRKNANTTNINNGNFNLGTAGTHQQPYPLTAEDWNTTGKVNGIVNTKYWEGINAVNPGRVFGTYEANNNLYMMCNTTAADNILTSPTFYTTAGTTTYFAFDAFVNDSIKAKAYLKYDNIVLGTITLGKRNQWYHYEFAITEDQLAATRSYYVEFELPDVGTIYLDHVKTTETANEQLANNYLCQNIDLSNPLKFNGIWQGNTEAYLATNDNNGIWLQNSAQQTVSITNTFTYDLTANQYYKLTITARGENANLSFDGAEDYLTVKNNVNNTYTIYWQPDSTLTTLTFNVTLGSMEDDVTLDGYIYITDFSITESNEDEYQLASKQQETNANIKLLSVASVTEPEPEPEPETKNEFNFFSQNWWYLVPSLITAVAAILAVATFLFRKFKFEHHITMKTASYARDVKIKTTHKKIVAEKSAKVDNVTDESSDH